MKSKMKTLFEHQMEELERFKQNPYSLWAKKLDKVVHIPIKDKDGFCKTICGSHSALLGNNYAPYHDKELSSICPTCLSRSYNYELWIKMNKNMEFLNENEYKEDEYHGYLTKEKRVELLQECKEICDHFIKLEGTPAEKKFFWQDKTGRGESNTYDSKDMVIMVGENEESYLDGSYIDDFVKEAEVGDTWANTKHNIIRIQ